jgi:hypothetical protein
LGVWGPEVLQQIVDLMLLQTLVTSSAGYFKRWLLQALVTSSAGYFKRWLLQALVTSS